MRILIFLTLSALVINTSALKSGGCTDWQPPGAVFYNHNDYIEPYNATTCEPSFPQDYTNLMQKRLDQYVEAMLEDAPPSYECVYGDQPCNWFYLGSSGRAMLFWRLYYTNLANETKASQYLNYSKQYIDGSLSRLKDGFDDYISFLNGNVGVYCIASVIYDSLGQHDVAMGYVDKVKEVFTRNMTHLIDYDDGIGGFLYALEFLEEYYGTQLFNRSDVVRMAQHLFDYGYEHKLENGTLMFPEPAPDNRLTIGFGRGTAGSLFRLLQVPEILTNDTILYHLKITVDYLVERQTAEGQVVDIQSGMEERVQWCHGSPSALPVLALAYKLSDDEKYLKAAEIAAEYTFKYGVLVKGMSLCHGTSSNIYMILYLYQTTGNPKWLYYAYEMHKFALDTPQLTDPDQLVSYDCLGSYSAFVDSVAAAIGTYSDFLANIETPEKMWMMGWGKINTPLNKVKIPEAKVFL